MNNNSLEKLGKANKTSKSDQENFSDRKNEEGGW